MYTSARQSPPNRGSATLRLEVAEAMSLWRDIPDTELRGAVDGAIVSAGNFLATNGAVVKQWRERSQRPLELDHAALGRRDQREREIAAKNALPEPDMRTATPEYRAHYLEEFKKAIGGL